ncbi:hypothetical protein VCUG_01971 [Vavraia culicis subsp. floridensis]|uniref:Major facilitator superfamily associated domain-containing protein n=1 Tax=Vavraia culicis (isolate floridensis) TaxID=948595 RepID=L2GTB4_VAVCU|nr:uncharacterized protein VCUG_01971 [Vavraia culicis subsp. floridensis]ELA46538.1 hypothetical protein VCUG_01971 [Vavraia culicis subsp. floridensis]
MNKKKHTKIIMEPFWNLIRSYVIPLKLLYFFINVQYYAFYQFRGPFAVTMFNVSKEHYGSFLGIILAVCFFTNTVLATTSDKFGRPKLFICTLLIVSMVSFELFYLWPAAKEYESIFWVVMFLYSFFNTAIPPLLDRFAIEYLNNTPNTGARAYGRQRLWGTVGYLLGNMAVETLCRSEPKKYDFNSLKYYVPLVTIPAVLFSALFIKSYDRTERSNADIESSWVSFVKNKPYLFFIFIILLNGITRAGMTMYLSIYQTEILMLEGYTLSDRIPKFLQSIINVVNKNPISTTATCGVLFEIIILYYSQNIVGRCGLYWPLLFAQVAQFVRFAGYYVLPYDNPNTYMFSCLLETMKGVNFGLTHSSGVHIANMMCPPHLKATSQMIYTGTFTGLASFVGGQIFGLVFSSKINNEDMSSSDKAKIFSNFYIVNMLITSFAIVLFVYKYGMRDRVLSFDSLAGRAPQKKIEERKVVMDVDEEEGGSKPTNPKSTM